MFYMASSRETDADEDHGDIGQMTSNNGQEYLLQIVFNIQGTGVHGDPWYLSR